MAKTTKTRAVSIAAALALAVPAAPALAQDSGSVAPEYQPLSQANDATGGYRLPDRTAAEIEAAVRGIDTDAARGAAADAADRVSDAAARVPDSVRNTASDFGIDLDGAPSAIRDAGRDVGLF